MTSLILLWNGFILRNEEISHHFHKMIFVRVTKWRSGILMLESFCFLLQIQTSLIKLKARVLQKLNYVGNMLQACNYVVVGNLLSTKELLDARVHPYITKFSYFQLKTEIFL